VGRTSPSPLPIKRSFRNAATRPRNAASPVGKPRKTIRVDPVIVPLLPREPLLYVQDAASRRRCPLSLAATVRFTAVTVTRRAKAAAHRGAAERILQARLPRSGSLARSAPDNFPIRGTTAASLEACAARRIAPRRNRRPQCCGASTSCCARHVPLHSKCDAAACASSRWTAAALPVTLALQILHPESAPPHS
jgi:hypothetical protein